MEMKYKIILLEPFNIDNTGWYFESKEKAEQYLDSMGYSKIDEENNIWCGINSILKIVEADYDTSEQN